MASVIIGIAYQNSYSITWDPPNTPAIQQLQWVAQHYGYGNKSVILVINGFNNYLWTVALTGIPIYFGHLSYLLSNTTENAILDSQSASDRSAYIGSMQVLWVDGMIPSFHPNRYTIIVASGTYDIRPQEMQILQTVSPGIYSVQKLSEVSLQQWLAEWCSQNECA
jgi:hypothetical protein